MGEYGGMLAGAGLVAYIVIGLFGVLFAWWGYRFFKGKEGRKPPTDLPSDDYKAVSEEIKGAQQGATAKKIILGTGAIKCLCFHKIKGVNAADFTTIPKPVGEMYQFDPSCPVSGSGYIVRENDEGEIIDYDPREVTFLVKESPEYAWFASNWDIVKTVFFVPIQWWKSASTLFAAAMLAIILIVSLAVLG